MGMEPIRRYIVAKDSQLVFDFITQDNIANGRTCANCHSQERCVTDGVTCSIDKTCGEWSEDTSKEQDKDAEEFQAMWNSILGQYGVTKGDNAKLYKLAQMF